MANRQQRRKSNDIFKDDNYTQNAKNVIMTIAIVLIVFIGFYYITVKINDNARKLNTKEPEEKEAVIQYDEILAGSVFNKSPEAYYVLFFDFSAPNASYYQTIASEYNDGENNILYTVDLGNAFNRNYVAAEGEKTNPKVKKISNLKVKEATLMKIEKGKNVFYYEGTLTEIYAKLD